VGLANVQQSINNHAFVFGKHKFLSSHVLECHPLTNEKSSFINFSFFAIVCDSKPKIIGLQSEEK
jgi:hypothetical protein